MSYFTLYKRKSQKIKKAPAHSKAKQEYLLTTKLFCGHCKEMMTGIKGNSHTGKEYFYYKCNNAKKKLCDKKVVRKEYIEDIVFAECLKLLTNSNIDKIAKEVVRVCEREKDTARLNELSKKLTNVERKQRNLMSAIVECDIDTVRKSLYNEVPILEQEKQNIEKEISLENSKQFIITVPQIKAFLLALKKGDIDSLMQRRMFINVDRARFLGTLP